MKVDTRNQKIKGVLAMEGLFLVMAVVVSLWRRDSDIFARSLARSIVVAILGLFALRGKFWSKCVLVCLEFGTTAALLFVMLFWIPKAEMYLLNYARMGCAVMYFAAAGVIMTKSFRESKNGDSAGGEMK